MKNSNSHIQTRKLLYLFGLLLITTYLVSNSYSKITTITETISSEFLPDSIPPDTIAEYELEDTIVYADGADTIYEINDSIMVDSLGMDLKTIEPTGNIYINFGGTTKTINGGIYGIHIGGMFDNSTLPNDGSNDYGWQWLIDLAPDVLRFPSGSYSKFMHLLHDPYTGNNAIGYGYNLFEIARYFDWTDGTMDFDFTALSAFDINHILYDGDADLSTWIRDDEVSSYIAHYKNFRNKSFTQACETRRYIDDFIDLVNQIDAAYPGRPTTKVILDLNILSETATECRAIADYLRAHDVNVVGVEMGNETYADFFCDAMEFDDFNDYFNFIQGTNLTGNVNVLNDIPGTSADMWGDHDFITKFKTGGGFNYKIGVCGMPLGNDFVFKMDETTCAETDAWNDTLRNKYIQTVAGTSKYKFDAVIMHTYLEPENYQNIPITNLTSVTTCGGTGDLWQFGVFDTRLQNAYEKIIGVSGESGNFKEFLTKNSGSYKAYKISFDKFNDYFDFDLTTAEKKELWTTEWNLKDNNKNLSETDQTKTEIYSNGFTHAFLLMQWWLKNIKINFDGDYRQGFYTYTTLQNFAGGTSTDLISPSDGIEREYFGIDDCPFVGDCGDGCSWDEYFDQRKYHIRRTTYFVTDLFSQINKRSLKYLPSTFFLGFSNLNMQPTVFINPSKDTLYIYYTNVKDDYQNYILQENDLKDLYTGAYGVDFGAATITYLQASQLYSTSGKTALYDKTYINTCYATYDHPFEITPTSEAGISPAILTNANSPQCGSGGGIVPNGCLSTPAYSVGYIKVPLYPYFIPKRESIADNLTEVTIYPNPASNAFFIKPSYSGNVDYSSVYTITILNMQGEIMLQQKTTALYAINVAQIPSGVYEIIISDTNNKRFYKKFIKAD